MVSFNEDDNKFKQLTALNIFMFLLYILIKFAIIIFNFLFSVPFHFESANCDKIYYIWMIVMSSVSIFGLVCKCVCLILNPIDTFLFAWSIYGLVLSVTNDGNINNDLCSDNTALYVIIISSSVTIFLNICLFYLCLFNSISLVSG
jgi:hypothetical protein